MIEEKKHILTKNGYEKYSTIEKAYHYLKGWMKYKYINLSNK